MTLEDFKDITLRGEIKEDTDGTLYWYYESLTDDEDTADELWDTYCEDMEEMRREFPNIVIKDSWADNDSCGFTIVSV